MLSNRPPSNSNQRNLQIKDKKVMSSVVLPEIGNLKGRNNNYLQSIREK